MTRAEILDCLTDRPCDSCKFHESGKCERWNCVFEEKPDDAEDCEDADEIADLQNRLDIAEYDKDRWKEKVTVLEEKLKALSVEPCEDATLKDIFCMGCEYKEQEPCEDCISRQAMADTIENWLLCDDYNHAERHIMRAVLVELYTLPSITPKIELKPNKDGVKTELYRVKTELESEDAISRQAVQIELNKCEVIDVRDENDNLVGYYNADTVDSIVRNLPPVTPNQKMGHWIKVDDEEPIAYDCSECVAMVSRRYRFCPDCGAKMEDTE